MTGLSRQQAAEAVAALFGATAIHSRSSRTYDPWEVTDNEGKTWRFVFDASIRATHRSGRRQLSTGDDTYKVEMNSPKLEYSEMGKLQDVVRTLRHAGAVVNSSCGMHVHVDASKHTPQSLKNALSIMYSKEDTHTAKPKPGGFPLSHMMKCGFCGSTFQRHLKKEGARWCCYQHRKDKSLCVMEVVAESEVYQTFLLMYNKLLDNKNLILRVMLAQLIELQSKTTFARPEIVDLNQKISDLARQNHSLSRLQAKGCIDSAIFIERSNRNNKLIEELRFELRQLQEPDRVSETIDQTNLLLDLLVDAQPMLEFEPSIFKSMIKEITVYPEKFSFVLSNGLVLCEMRR